ncbi:MAG: hypothetical protein RLZZ423_1307 [Cyanobacteriota bacterium]
MACPQCGSWSVRADRSLAGRMVCGRCGTPLQGVPRQGGRSRPRRPPLFRISGGPRHSWRWWLLGLLAAGAALAAIAPEGPRSRQRVPFLPDPADAPADRPDHRWQ